MPSSEDRQLIIRAFNEDCIWPANEPTLKDAWLGIYQLLLWYEHGYIHIREANDLQRNKTWQRRATEAEAYMATALNVKPTELATHVDRMMQLPRWRDALHSKATTATCPHCGLDFLLPKKGQRNNPLGNGLRILTAEVLRRWGDSRFTYEEEASAATWFPGITMPGRSLKPKIDILAHADKRVRVIISCKWSGRHDRMSDVTNECQQYRQASAQQQNMNFQHFVVTNELDGQRTDKILNQPCIDGLVMVHLPVAQKIGTMTPMMERNIMDGRLLDLSEFVELTHTWRSGPAADWRTPEQRTKSIASDRSTSGEQRIRQGG